jgi:hypothetical protein
VADERIRVVVEGNSEDLRRAIRSAVSDIRGFDRAAVTSSTVARGYGRSLDQVGDKMDRLSRKTGEARRAQESLGVSMMGVGVAAGAVSLGPLIGGLGSLSAGAIAAAAALAPLGGVLAALPQGLSALGQGFGVAKLATDGLSEAFKGLQAEHAKSGQAAKTHAAAVASSAASVVSSERAVANAKRTVVTAESALTVARAAAIRQLEDMRIAADRATLSEAGASISLREAKERLRAAESSSSSSLDLAAARQGVDEARASFKDAHLSGKRARADNAKAQAGGIEGDKGVASAREALASANRSVTAATDGLTQAQQRSHAAMAQTTARATALTEALDKLGPAGRDFLKTMEKFEGLKDVLGKTAQAGFLPGLASGLNAAAKNFGPLNEIVGETAKAMGDMAKSAGEFLGSDKFRGDFLTIGKDNVSLLKQFGEGMGNLFKSLTNVMIAARPFTDWLSTSAVKVTASIEKWTEGARKSGEIARLLNQTKETLQQFGTIFGGTGKLLFNLVEASRVMTGPMLDGLGKMVQNAATLTTPGSHGFADLKRFFDEARAPLGALGKLVGALVTDLVGIAQMSFPAFTELATVLREDVLPPLNDAIVALEKTVFPHLLELVKSIARLVKTILPGLQALMPVVNLIIDGLKLITNSINAILGHLHGAVRGVASLAVGAAVFASWKKLIELMRAAAAWSGLASAGGGAAAGGAAGGAAAGGLGSKLFAPAVKASPFVANSAAGFGGGAASGSAGGLLARVGTKFGGGRLLGAGVLGVGAADIGIGVSFAKGIATGLKTHDWKGAMEQTRHEITLGLFPGPKDYSKVDKLATDSVDVMMAAARKRANDRKLGITDFIDFKGASAAEIRAGLDPVMDGINDLIVTQSQGYQKVSTESWKNYTERLTKNVGDMTKYIKLHLGKDTLEGKQALSTNFEAAAAAVKKSMDASGKTTKAGLHEIQVYMRKALAEFGITGHDASLYLSGQDPHAGQEGGKDVANVFKKAGGGYIGAPGAAGGDDIPIMVGAGEAILNRHQQAPVEYALQAQYGMGLGDLFDTVKRPHYMAGGGFVADPGKNFSMGSEPEIAKRLSSLGRALGVMFHGISGYRSPAYSVSVGGTANDPHTRGEAADIGGGNIKTISEAVLERYGLTRPMQSWQGRDERNHIQLFGGGGVRGAVGPMGSTPGAASPGHMAYAKLRGPKSALKAIVQAGLDRATDAGNAQLGGGSAGPAPKGNVRSWIRAGLKVAGQPVTEASVNLLYGRVMQESTGDPHAINLWDSNAKAGHPSKGLLQTIDSTFNAYKVPGHSDIWNPVDNVAAAVRYMLGQYGHLVGQSGTGYAQGGFIKAAKGLVPRAHAARTPARRTKIRTLPAPGTSPSGAKPLLRDISRLEGSITDRGTAYELAQHGYGQIGGGVDLMDRADAKIQDPLTDAAGLVVAQSDFAAGRTKRATELNSLLGIDRGIGSDYGAELGDYRLLFDAATKGIAISRGSASAIRATWATNVTKVKTVAAKISALRRKTHRTREDNARLESLTQQETNLRKENDALVGSTGTGAIGETPGGRLGKVLADGTSWSDTLAATTDPLHNLPSNIASNLLDQGDLKDLLQQLGERAMATSGSGGAAPTALADLMSQQNALITQSNAIAASQLDVFKGFVGGAGGPAFLGSFAHGSDGPVMSDGLAFVHRGETIQTDPSGPYGSRIAQTAAAPNVELHLHGAADQLVNLIDARVDGKVAMVDSKLGRQSRILSVAPGG